MHADRRDVYDRVKLTQTPTQTNSIGINVFGRVASRVCLSVFYRIAAVDECTNEE